MKGCIKKDKKTGNYFYVIDMSIDPLTGNRTQKKKRGSNNKKEAKHALSEFLNDVRQNVNVKVISERVGHTSI
ncbi:Arm DNA-binding domain-containing protein [Peribacillus sp. NPDC096622]|uniref:Arm DNA-binding domain-containing protein n=1 Tax=Peribacillus sp. NPDC096622 TaxID=3364396 RepID=UPI00381B9246